MQNAALLARVFERHVAKLDLPARARKAPSAAVALGRHVQYLEYTLPRGDALLQRAADVDEAAERGGNEHQRRQECPELIHPHVVRKYQSNGHVKRPASASEAMHPTTGLLKDLARASFMFEARLSSLATSNRSV